MQKLLILDGNSVLHRAYHAMPDWRNRSGEATSGVYGFLSMMLRAIEELKPTHLVVVFDYPGPTFRHTMYVGYQTNREQDRQVSEDIWGQVEKLKIVLEKMGVPVCQVSGFEADDVIGTLAKQCAEEVVIITGDRDLMQLITDRVRLYMPVKGVTDGVLVDRDAVKARLGVWPEQVVDYKALVGDSSDNYPGVAGIGPKTATKLLEEFGDFDSVVQKSGNLKIINGYEGGVLSRRLATINTNSPITLNLDRSILPSQEKIVEVLRELGHKSLIRRVSGEDVTIDESQPKLFE